MSPKGDDSMVEDSLSGGGAQRERRTDDEIMKEIKAKYYEQELGADTVIRGIMDALPSADDDPASSATGTGTGGFGAWLENAVWEHERALELTSTELSARVLASYAEFVEGMKRIHDVGVNLQQSTVVCRSARLSLRMSRAALAGAALELCARQRRR
jgi:hypothetical protein